jgi:hypothetical protein
MSKLGRNDPCHCKSGKKYKHCCIEKDAAADSARLAKEANERRLLYDFGSDLDHDHHDHVCADCEQVQTAADAIFDLLDAKKYDEAERAALALVREYPEAIDGPDCLGLVAEQRGDRATAAKYYRQALAILEAFIDPHGRDDDAKRWYRTKIAELDPEAA